MTESHRLVALRKGFGKCSCGKVYAEGSLYGSTEGIRAAHREHKAEAKPTSHANVTKLIAEVDTALAVAVDTEVARLWSLFWTMADRADVHRASISEARKMIRAGYERGGSHYADRIAASQAKVDAIMEEARPLRETAVKYNEENYKGWNRFFTVADGHIHSSTSCHSLRPTTRIGWTPSLSGCTEAEAVAELGPTLCTHCFPSAPVEWTVGVARTDVCEGSGRGPAKNKRPYARYQPCSVCGTNQSVTSRGAIRSHKTPAS